MQNIVIGIDIGGTNTVFGFVDKDGKILAKTSILTAKYFDAASFVNALFEAVCNLEKRLNNKVDIRGIGIGVPNGNYYTGNIEFAPNLPWKGVTNMRELFKSRFRLPVVLTNDANAAAYGEMLFGAAKGMKHFVVITLGTGVGSGIVVNGDIVYGHDGFAGELGHTIIIPDGRKCGCGRKGCLETYASASGICTTVKELLAEKNVKSDLRAIQSGKLTAKLITDAAIKDDKIAIEAFDKTAKILGLCLANTVAYTSPEAIIMFGGLANAGDLLLIPLKKYFEENLLKIYKNKVHLLISGLMEENAAILGAAALAWKNN